MTMKHYQSIQLPVGVSLTHDKGYPVVFGYVGGHGRLGMKAKRFNPNVIGSVEEAIERASQWRVEALAEHAEAMAALPARGKGAEKRRQAAARGRAPAKKRGTRLETAD